MKKTKITEARGFDVYVSERGIFSAVVGADEITATSLGALRKKIGGKMVFFAPGMKGIEVRIWRYMSSLPVTGFTSGEYRKTSGGGIMMKVELVGELGRVAWLPVSTLRIINDHRFDAACRKLKKADEMTESVRNMFNNAKSIEDMLSEEIREHAEKVRRGVAERKADPAE